MIKSGGCPKVRGNSFSIFPFMSTMFHTIIDGMMNGVTLDVDSICFHTSIGTNSKQSHGFPGVFSLILIHRYKLT